MNSNLHQQGAVFNQQVCYNALLFKLLVFFSPDRFINCLNKGYTDSLNLLVAHRGITWKYSPVLFWPENISSTQHEWFER